MNTLPAKDRRIIKEHLAQLENPISARDVEVLREGLCRMNIAHTYTAFFVVLPDCVRVIEVMTTEEAHKRYKRFRKL